MLFCNVPAIVSRPVTTGERPSGALTQRDRADPSWGHHEVKSQDGSDLTSSPYENGPVRMLQVWGLSGSKNSPYPPLKAVVTKALGYTGTAIESTTLESERYS